MHQPYAPYNTTCGRYRERFALIEVANFRKIESETRIGKSLFSIETWPICETLDYNTTGRFDAVTTIAIRAQLARYNRAIWQPLQGPCAASLKPDRDGQPVSCVLFMMALRLIINYGAFAS
jgi:hypothetical protein